MSNCFRLNKCLLKEHRETILEIGLTPHTNPKKEKVPSTWCDWRPSTDNVNIQWSGMRSDEVNELFGWIVYLIKNYLKPWGYTLNGHCKITDDDGLFIIRDNVVRYVHDDDDE